VKQNPYMIVHTRKSVTD